MMTPTSVCFNSPTLLTRIHVGMRSTRPSGVSNTKPKVFADYVAALVGVIGHADRAPPLPAYCAGLLMPAARKTVEPMAAMTAPARVAAQHQSLLHFVGQAPWSDTAVLTKVRDLVLPPSRVLGPSRPGSSTIPASPRR